MSALWKRVRGIWRRRSFLDVGLIVCWAGAGQGYVWAQDLPVQIPAPGEVVTPSQSEPPFEHVRTVDFDPSTVVAIEGCVNFQTMISLAPDETVQNIAVGDSTAWQAMPNRRGDRLFLKTMNETGLTNMTVVSNRHSYFFELRVAPPDICADGRIAYEVRFRYPPSPALPEAGSVPVASAPSLPAPERRNSAYTFTGNRELVPIRVFDDGISTYMLWPVGVMAVSISAMTADHHETLVNFSLRDSYMVIDQVAPAFILRRSDFQVTLYNDSYAISGLDALSPRRRKGGG